MISTSHFGIPLALQSTEKPHALIKHCFTQRQLLALTRPDIIIGATRVAGHKAFDNPSTSPTYTFLALRRAYRQHRRNFHRRNWHGWRRGQFRLPVSHGWPWNNATRYGSARFRKINRWERENAARDRALSAERGVNSSFAPPLSPYALADKYFAPCCYIGKPLCAWRILPLSLSLSLCTIYTSRVPLLLLPSFGFNVVQLVRTGSSTLPSSKLLVAYWPDAFNVVASKI